MTNKKIEDLEAEINALKEEVAQFKKEKYKAREYQYMHEEKLCPPAYLPSSHEIALAKARYVFENDIWESVYYLKQYIKSLEGEELSNPFTPESVRDNAHRYLAFWEKSLNKWTDDNDIWDCFLDDNWFNEYVKGLSEHHSGDCTAFPASCMRCHSENIFKIPNTANWSKAQGYKMEKEFMADYRAKKDSSV